MGEMDEDDYDSNEGAAHFNPFSTLEVERDRYRKALEEIAAPPREDDSDALDILQEHWTIAAMALTGKGK